MHYIFHKHQGQYIFDNNELPQTPKLQNLVYHGLNIATIREPKGTNTYTQHRLLPTHGPYKNVALYVVNNDVDATKKLLRQSKDKYIQLARESSHPIQVVYKPVLKSTAQGSFELEGAVHKGTLTIISHRQESLFETLVATWFWLIGRGNNT
jgi:hypothetical protein